MSAEDETKTAGYPAAEGVGHGHGHAGHGEDKAEGHSHGDGHDCGVDHGDGNGDAHGHGGHGSEGHGNGDDDEEGGAPDMAGLEAMMGGMGGGEGGAGGMDMNALMAMLGKGGGKGGEGGGMDMASMMGGMGGMGGGMGGKGGGKGQAPPEDTDEKKGEKWVWMQKGEEVHIRFALGEPATKKDISVTFKSNTLKVVIRGETTIDGPLGGKVDVDDCTWVLSPEKDELQVMLTKVEGKTDAWKDLLA